MKNAKGNKISYFQITILISHSTFSIPKKILIGYSSFCVSDNEFHHYNYKLIVHSNAQIQVTQESFSKKFQFIQPSQNEQFFEE